MKKTKSKVSTVLIVLATLVLAGVAIFTAMRLYNLREEAVAPTAPTSVPRAQETEDPCAFTFTLTTPTPTPTATPTPIPECDSTCESDSQCPSSMVCYTPTGGTTGNCRNPQCLTQSSCICATATPTTTPTSTATATATSTPVATKTPTATPTTNPQCNTSCTNNTNCPSDMVCYIPSGSTTGNCRNPQCLTDSDCICSVATTTTSPELPEAGTSWPTILGFGFGMFIIMASVILAL